MFASARGPDGGEVRFGVLGPFEVTVAGRPVAAGGVRQRGVLAVLVLHANEVVPVDRLIADVWGEEPPPTAHKMIHVYVSRWRTSLVAHSGRRDILLTRPPGYVLRVRPDESDLARFDSLVVAARSVAARDPAGAAATLREALGLWRGDPLADLADEPFARAAIPRLEESRRAAFDERVDAELAVGPGPGLIVELQAMVVADPLRERSAGQLMLALYRTGRQAEALEVYARVHRSLADELGIDPGPDLQRIQGAILRQEPWLEGLAPGPTPSRAAAAHPATPAPETSPPEAPAARSGRPTWRVTRQRFAWVTAGLLVSALVIASVIAAAAGRAPGPPNVAAAADSLAVVDPGGDSIVEDIAVGAAPGPVVAADRSAWVADVEDHTLLRIDLATGRMVKTFGLGAAPTSLSATAGAVWIGNGFAGTLSRVLTAYDQLSSPFFPGPSISGLLAVYGTPDDLWVGLANGRLLRLDPASMQPRAAYQLAVRAKAMALVGGGLWVLDFQGTEAVRVDVSHGSPPASVALSGAAIAIAASAGSIWVAASGDDRLLQIDPGSGRIVATVPLSFQPIAVAATDAAVWVGGGPNGTLARVDPTGRSLVTTVDLGRPIEDLTVADGQLLLTLR